MPEMEQNSQYEELPAGKSMKVSLPDGRALIVESGTSYPGAFIGVLDKNGSYRDLVGVEQYPDYQQDGEDIGPALVTHKWNLINGDIVEQNPRDVYTSIEDLEQSEAYEHRIADNAQQIPAECSMDKNKAKQNLSEALQSIICIVIRTVKI